MPKLNMKKSKYFGKDTEAFGSESKDEVKSKDKVEEKNTKEKNKGGEVIGRSYYFEEQMQDFDFTGSNKILNILSGLIFRPYRLVSTIAVKLPIMNKELITRIMITSLIFIGVILNTITLIYGLVHRMGLGEILYYMYVPILATVICIVLYYYLLPKLEEYHEYDFKIEEDLIDEEVYEQDTIKEQVFEPSSEKVKLSEEYKKNIVQRYSMNETLSREDLLDTPVYKVLDSNEPSDISENYAGIEEELISRKLDNDNSNVISTFHVPSEDDDKFIETLHSMDGVELNDEEVSHEVIEMSDEDLAMVSDLAHGDTFTI